jgi:hypothetical protein
MIRVYILQHFGISLDASNLSFGNTKPSDKPTGNTPPLFSLPLGNNRHKLRQTITMESQTHDKQTHLLAKDISADPIPLIPPASNSHHILVISADVTGLTTAWVLLEVHGDNYSGDVVVF